MQNINWRGVTTENINSDIFNIVPKEGKNGSIIVNIESTSTIFDGIFEIWAGNEPDNLIKIASEIINSNNITIPINFILIVKYIQFNIINKLFL